METQHVAVDIHVPEDADDEVPGEPNNTEIQHQQMAVIDVHVPEAPEELPAFVMNKLNKVPGKPLETRPVTIFRFPAWFHEINKDLCEPKAVSIGPYHRGKESLRAMEEHKWSTLQDFLARNNNVGCEVYLREMGLMEARARECYSENVNMASNDFLLMLLLDGCFILEYLMKYRQEYWNAILDVGWVECDTLSDTFLMENQLPFFVLHKLFVIQSRCGRNCEGPCSLLEVIYDATGYQGKLLRYRQPQISCSEAKIHHLLHFFYSRVTPDFQLRREHAPDLVASKQSNFFPRRFPSIPWSKVFTKSGKSKLDNAPRVTELQEACVEFREKKSDVSIIPCVTELHEAGVKFRKKRSPDHTFDISFENGTLEIPSINIDGIIKIILWNMVGFEQTQPLSQRNKIVSSYLGLMDSLLNTEKDVVILERAGIIKNLLQNEEEAATFFNQFGRIFVLDYSDHYLYDVYKELKRYSESTCHKYRARLMHDYCNNPWSAISVLAASILLILTFLQTYYSAAN